MAEQLTSALMPIPMEPRKWARNGRTPIALLGSKVLAGYNHVLAWRRKCVFSKCLHLNNLPAGQAGTVVPWRAYIRTGYAATGSINLEFHTIAAPGDNAAASIPRVRWDVSGGIGSTRSLYCGVNTGSIGPDDLVYGTYTLAVAADTAYEINLDAIDYGVPVAACIYEVHDKAFTDGATGASDPRTIAVGNQITDTQHNDLLFGGHNLWSRNGAHLISWCTDEDPDNGGDAPQITNAVAVNCFDQALSTVTNTSPGWFVNTKNLNPYHSDDIPCVLAVYAKNASSAGGSVSLRDSTGALATVSSFSTAGEWKTTAVNLSGAQGSQKLDLFFAGDGSNQLTVYAASLYQYV